MPYAICTVSAAAVRKEDSHRSEMTSQILFGETVEVLEEKGEWFRVRMLFDDYEGWTTWHMIQEADEALAMGLQNFVASSLVNPLTLPDQLLNLPMGAGLTGFDPETRLLWKEDYKYHGTFRDIRKKGDMDLLKKLTHAWINAPYLWGGKTFMGVDCSGFVQTVFKVAGIRLLRDAWQQAEGGMPVDSISKAKEGDLAFFCNEKGRVTHVGIVLDGGRIVHASGKVRIDVLDEKGIYNREAARRTHDLLSIRRYF
jgi:hypothetical protein